jgi:hypothetical protein
MVLVVVAVLGQLVAMEPLQQVVTAALELPHL